MSPKVSLYQNSSFRNMLKDLLKNELIWPNLFSVASSLCSYFGTIIKTPSTSRIVQPLTTRWSSERISDLCLFWFCQNSWWRHIFSKSGLAPWGISRNLLYFCSGKKIAKSYLAKVNYLWKRLRQSKFHLFWFNISLIIQKRNF